MRRKFYWLLLLFLGLPNLAVATRKICGAPPPDQFKEENSESIKGELAGKANLLSSYVGKAELGGKIEAARQESFAKYPDANAAYLDRYFAYTFCFAIFDPKNPQSPEDKIKAIEEFKRQQRPQSSINDQQKDLHIAILRLRADAIASDLDKVIKAFGSRKAAELNVEQLTELKQRFLALHEQHISAVTAGDIHLAHEITGEIHDLLFTIHNVAHAAYTASAQGAYRFLPRQYVSKPELGTDPAYDAVAQSLRYLYEATVSRTRSMRYHGEPPSSVPRVIASNFTIGIKSMDCHV